MAVPADGVPSPIADPAKARALLYEALSRLNRADRLLEIEREGRKRFARILEEMKGAVSQG